MDRQEAALTKADFTRIDGRVQQTEAVFDRGFLYHFRRSMMENKLSYLAMAVLIVILLASVFAFLSPYDPDAMNFAEKLQRPSLTHPFGTDGMGRDYFTRALYGGRISLLVGFFSMLVSIGFGTLFGTISGFIGGKTDMFMMRFADIFMSVPSFLLMIIINSFISPSLFTMIIIIGMFAWTGVARVVRAETMSLKERDFIMASRGLGAGSARIIFKEIIPNITSQIIVSATLSIARAIITESSLSFLGFGVQLPKASWGSMLNNAQKTILDLPHLAVFPGALILFTVFSFHILGDVLRNALEPKMIK